MKPNLCQPGGGASCGACCGLYNFSDHAQPAVAAQLGRQTDALADVPRTREAYSAAARALKDQQPPPAFPDVKVCPLLGYLDHARTRVGCLAHPTHTGGTDLRDCGAYDARTCEEFECPSYTWLDADEAALIRDACPDWYLYGLVVTDVDFVRGVFRLLARTLGEQVRPARLQASSEVVAALAALFRLKGRDAAGVFGRFGPAPEASGEPGLRTLDYAALGASAAPEDDLLLCIGRAPRTLNELQEARTEVRASIQNLSAVVSATAT